MGCELGKLASSGDSKKEVENNVNEPPAPQAPDPRLPLTARQKYSMVASWKGISRAMETTGINMFIKWVLRDFDRWSSKKVSSTSFQRHWKKRSILALIRLSRLLVNLRYMFSRLRCRALTPFVSLPSSIFFHKRFLSILSRRFWSGAFLLRVTKCLSS